MALEIERKFLLKNDDWRELATGKPYRQGYIKNDVSSAVRVRIAGDQAFLTIKSEVTGATRLEYEYLIPMNDAEEMLEKLCKKPQIEKMRYVIQIDDLTWEVDEFFAENEGLIVAEVELESENQHVSLPSWVGEEVTGDPKYYNANLIEHPYKNW